MDRISVSDKGINHSILMIYIYIYTTVYNVWECLSIFRIIMVMIRRRNLWLLRIAALFAGSFIAFISSHSTDAGGSSDVEEDSAGEDPPPTRRNQRDSPLATSDGFQTSRIGS